MGYLEYERNHAAGEVTCFGLLSCRATHGTGSRLASSRLAKREWIMSTAAKRVEKKASIRLTNLQPVWLFGTEDIVLNVACCATSDGALHKDTEKL